MSLINAVYSVVWFDALQVKIRHENRVISKSINLALGVSIEGRKELACIRVLPNEGAKFWLSNIT